MSPYFSPTRPTATNGRGRLAALFGPHPLRSDGDDVTLGALHDGKQFLMLRLGHIEFGHGVIKILTEGDPLALGDLEMFVGFAHGAASVFLWAARGPANHLGHIVFEARRADAVMRFVNRSVRIQDRVVHNPINEVVDHGGNRIDPARGASQNGYWSAVSERRKTPFSE